MRHIFKVWTGDRKGSIAITTALTAVALAVGMGAVTEYSRANGLRTTLEGALDSATLAAAGRLSSEILSNAAVDDIVARQLSANLALNDPDLAVKTLAVVVDTSGGVLSASASVDLPMLFGAFLGIDRMEVSAQSSATFGARTVELALVLDVTGSMEGQKLADLKTAAKNLVDQLLPADGRMDDKVRISLVPFAQAVNVGSYASVIKQNTGGYWAYSRKRGSYWVSYENDCATERNNDSFMDVSPVGNKLRGDASACPSTVLQPLTNDRTVLHNRIDGFVASGGTAGHLGVAFGWYTLSPNWTDIWPTAADPAPYGDNETLKFLVFMTDGDFNTWYTSSNGSSTVQAEAFCTNAKASDVVIFTVGFQTSTAATDMMRRCATSSTTFFATSSGDGLVDAFKAIATAVQTIYLAS